MEGDPHGPSTLLTISQLSQRIKTLLLDTFADVRVVGELSDVSRPQSGHLYLTLKDANAQIRAVIWRNTARFLDFELSDGQEVACRGEIDVYPPRGSYQLIIRQIEPVGLGQLQQQLKQLQRRLAAEGLFDPAKKRPLPRFPRLVAFVTSPTGAAIHDFLEVVRRRWRGVRVLLIPARVQGAGAAAEIARGIEAANALRPRPDVLVVGRGGGSMEDLWCFNEEVVVRAIEQSVIPTVSAVGHEVDVTLADLAADVRALTPSEAAERVVPSQTDVLAGLKGLESRLSLALRRRANEARLRLDTLANARVMRRPHDRLHEFARILDDLSRRATFIIQDFFYQFYIQLHPSNSL